MVQIIIPDKAFEQHMIVLGKTGAGKSSAIRYMVEHLLDLEQRVIVVTPKADWWGLKLSADGQHAGYPVVIFGGEHSDMPLHHLSGKTMAELLGTGNRSAVLQMRDFMPSEKERFWTDFASNLFRLLQGKLFLVIDEVHNFAPKGRVEGEAGKMLHWSNKLASEARGLGITLIGASQRASKVHNDFLTSCETLIAMRVTTHWDREAVEAWIEGCGDDKQGTEVLNSLAQMKRGDAWVWSPEIEFGPSKLHFPMFKTYDSFKPQAPTETAKLRGWADVNLEDVRKKLATVVKEHEANDPAKLKSRVRDLEAELRKKHPVAMADDKAIERATVSMRRECDRAVANILAGQKALISNGARFAKELASLAERAAKLFNVEIPQFELPKAAPLCLRPSIPARRVSVPSQSNGHSEKLSGPERKILKAMSELLSIGKDDAPREMIAGWAGYSPNGGAFNNPLGHLRSLGLVEGNRLTESGQAAAGVYDPPDQDEVHRRIMEVCKGPERKILQPLLEANGESLSKEDLAAASGYALDGGAFNNPLGALRTKGFVDYPSRGMVKAADWLFAA